MPPLSRLRTYLQDILRKPPLNMHLLVMNLVILVLIFPPVSLVVRNHYHTFRSNYLQQHLTQMRQGVEHQISSLMESMLVTSVFALGSYEFFLLQEQMSELSKHDPAITYLTLMELSGMAVAHSDENKVLTELAAPMDKQAMVQLAGYAFSKRAAQVDTLFFSNEKSVTVEEKPILEGLIPIYSAGRLWGGLRCGYSLQGLQQSIKASREQWDLEVSRFNLLFIISMVTGVLLAAGASWFFSRFILRSTSLLALGVRRVAAGNLDHRITQSLPACREFCTLSDGFNQMTSGLDLAHRQLDEYSHSLEKKVEERTVELKEAQAHLVSQAREAGMAEMAIGVLHNIGNAITPAKVDVGLLLKEMRESPLKNNLGDALVPIQEIVAATPDLDEAEQQRMIKILKLLPNVFVEECEKITETLERVRAKHDHIEDIIRLQMRYAKLTGSQESILINQVVGDALAMMDDSLRKRQIDLQTELADLPPAKMEHARLMQIIVNLIKNGYEAIDAIHERGGGQLLVSTGREDEHLFISIKDNGMGFAPDDAEKIFSYGYSTKERGSGFGLHSAANFLIAQNGSITAHSDGPGQGAEFVVYLPVYSRRER